jgi:hypothetical protein
MGGLTAAFQQCSSLEHRARQAIDSIYWSIGHIGLISISIPV